MYFYLSEDFLEIMTKCKDVGVEVDHDQIGFVLFYFKQGRESSK